MLFILSAVGIIGGVVLGLIGLGAAGSELERILAIVFLAMAAAGFVGQKARAADRPVATERSGAPRRPLTLGGVVMCVAVAPIVATSIAVFLATLVPSVFICLPFFVIWWLGSEAARSAPSPAEAPIPAPAVA